MPAEKNKNEVPTGLIVPQSYRSPKYNKDVIQFYPPEHPTKEQGTLIANIVYLDHRSLNSLKPGTAEREEVKRLLTNVVIAGFEYKSIAGGNLLYQKAESIFQHHLQAKNRLRYLTGMIYGTAAAALISYLLAYVLYTISFPIHPERLLLLHLFAGMGSVTSVLSRLSTIDLREETSKFMVVISGATKPVVAIFFAIILYMILDTKIIDIQFGAPTETNKDLVYLISSFLCGFSERFAKDIIGRIPYASETT